MTSGLLTCSSLPAALRSSSAEEETMARPLEVTIGLDEQFTIVVTDDLEVTARPISVNPIQGFVAPGDKITFKSVNTEIKAFTIVFPDDSPFNTNEIHSRGAAATAPIAVDDN